MPESNMSDKVRREQGDATAGHSMVTPFALSIILISYLIIGFQYAARTPAWQTPDEPAHYNVIRQIAQTGRLPRLEVGDYDQKYMEQIVGQGFPPDLPVDRLEYQDYQPPLYYVLLTPIFILFNGALVPLRLASLLLGTGVIVFAFLTVHELFPTQPMLAPLTASFIAFIPQHVAMLAGVNNDALAELLIAWGLWRMTRSLISAELGVGPWELGLILGLAFITKVQAYVLAPVAALFFLMQWRAAGWGAWRRWLGIALWTAIPALLIGSLYWGRNWSVCGPLDVVCGQWHNHVVVGQPTTAAWIAEQGWARYLERFFTFTFDSFWGVFGWMGVFMDPRVYQALLLFSIGLVVGGVGAMRRWSALASTQRQGLGLLAVSGLVTLSLYLYYNLGFVQHQGRYLFPALIPIGLGAAAGLWQWARWGATLLRRLPHLSRFGPRVQFTLAFTPVVMLAALCLVALYRFVLPAL